MLIVDAHLDLAYNATRGRDPRMPAKDQPVVENEIATVGLPDLRAGNVGLVCATIFCEPKGPHGGYTTAEEARQQALTQLAWYRSCADEGLIRFAVTPLDLPDDVMRGTGFQPVSVAQNDEHHYLQYSSHGLKARATATPLSALLLLEGADAIRTPDDLPEWHAAGLRIVGLAWKHTRFAGGTGAPGPLTAEGRELVKALDQFKIIHDTSHLAEESFWNLMDLTTGPVIASHSNCRTIVGEGDRHLTDEMIREIAKRNGVIGINFFDRFLLPKDQYGKRRATLHDVIAHIKHICDLTGSARHVAIGTDMDGGLGREQIPMEIRTSADLPRVAGVLEESGFCGEDIERIMSANWLNLLCAALQAA